MRFFAPLRMTKEGLAMTPAEGFLRITEGEGLIMTRGAVPIITDALSSNHLFLCLDRWSHPDTQPTTNRQALASYVLSLVRYKE